MGRRPKGYYILRLGRAWPGTNIQRNFAAGNGQKRTQVPFFASSRLFGEQRARNDEDIGTIHASEQSGPAMWQEAKGSGCKVKPDIAGKPVVPNSPGWCGEQDGPLSKGRGTPASNKIT